MSTAILTMLLALSAQAPPAAPVLASGDDVQPPKRLSRSEPSYPEIARQARMQGLVILAVTVDEGGRPADVRVLRGIPLLDEAASAAIKKWRYAPTVVDGVPRRVKLVEHVGFYLSDSERVRSYGGLARDRRAQTPVRLFAISELARAPRKLQKEATAALTDAAQDPDESVAKAAGAALAQLASGVK